METLNSGQRYQLLHNTEEKNLQLSPGKLTVYQTENTTTPKKKNQQSSTQQNPELLASRKTRNT